MAPALPALAQPADPGARVLETARQSMVQANCAAATARQATAPTPLVDQTVRAATYYRVLVEGCGQRRQMNYVHIVLHDGNTRLLAMLPGTTAADPLLQRDALGAARMSAQAAVPECREVRPVGTDFDSPDAEPGAARRTRPWTETWHFDACGTAVRVPMLFTPTASGTSFTARRAERAPG